MRLFTTYSHTSTLRGYGASGKMLQQKTSNKERKTRKKVQNTPTNGGIDRRESYHFPHISEGKGAGEKGKLELCRKIETKTKCESAGVKGGRIKDLASKNPSGRKNVPELASYEAQLARAEWTSCPTCGGDVDVLPSTPCITRLWGCYKHRPPFAGFSTRQVPRWSLICIT